MEQIAQGKISREVLEEYKNIFRKVLAKLLKRKDLETVEITDEMLIKLLEYPCEAFEIQYDLEKGCETLRVKSSYLRELAKLLRTVVTEVGIDIDRDFDVYIDPVTGEKKYKLKTDVARKLGIPEGAEDMFEVYIGQEFSITFEHVCKSFVDYDRLRGLLIGPHKEALARVKVTYRPIDLATRMNYWRHFRLAFGWSL